MDSIARGPILSHYSETNTGLETIRAFKQQENFTNVFYHKLDCHTNVFYIINAGNRWLGICLASTYLILVSNLRCKCCGHNYPTTTMEYISPLLLLICLLLLLIALITATIQISPHDVLVNNLNIQV